MAQWLKELNFLHFFTNLSIGKKRKSGSDIMLNRTPILRRRLRRASRKRSALRS